MEVKMSDETNPLVSTPSPLPFSGAKREPSSRAEENAATCRPRRMESHERGAARAQRDPPARRAVTAWGASSGRSPSWTSGWSPSGFGSGYGRN